MYCIVNVYSNSPKQSPQGNLINFKERKHMPNQTHKYIKAPFFRLLLTYYHLMFLSRATRPHDGHNPGVRLNCGLLHCVRN